MLFRSTSVTIPNSVTNIGTNAFAYCSGLISVTIGKGVTSIGGDWVFSGCSNLISVTIPNSVTSIGNYAFQYCTKLSSLTIPNSVTSIGTSAFDGAGLINLTIPNSVTNISDYAFKNCHQLQGLYFQGQAPNVGWQVFYGNSATVYYLPGITGWGSVFDGHTARLWNPSIQTTNTSFGVRTNCFGFTITGTMYIPLVVEGCTNLAKATWTPLQTNTLTSGSIYFRDPQWTNYPARVYRIRSP